MAADDDNDTPITKAILDEVVDKLVKLVGDNGRKLDTDIADFRQELRLLSTSIKNVQTQVLDRQGCFDADASSASRPSLAPTHKLRFPKFNGSDDPITWLHKGEQFFHAYGTPDHLKVSTAAFYLQDAASQWYYRLEQNLGIPTLPSRWLKLSSTTSSSSMVFRRPLSVIETLCSPVASGRSSSSWPVSNSA